MKIILTLIVLTLTFTLLHCKQKKKVEDDELFKSVATKPIICIQPFGAINENEVRAVKDSLLKIYPLVQIKNSIALPEFAYYEKNKRYKADSLLKFLKATSNYSELLIGLTEKDISTTKDKIEDWGVMGLGNCPGNTCVVSTFRLAKENRKSQLFKVAIHELGHTQGLPHCPTPTCYMRDAEGKNPTNEEKGFCEKCKKYLKLTNWNL